MQLVTGFARDARSFAGQMSALFYGIGVHTGEAVLGNVGSMGRKEFAALGNATDVCKYLQEQAGPGEVIISEATFDLCGRYLGM